MNTQPDAATEAAEVLTLMEAATLLRIGRTTAYELAHEYLDTGGTSGLPVIRAGRQLRVTRVSLNDVMACGTSQERVRNAEELTRTKPPTSDPDCSADSCDDHAQRPPRMDCRLRNVTGPA